jgi:hypothetical protein
VTAHWADLNLADGMATAQIISTDQLLSDFSFLNALVGGTRGVTGTCGKTLLAKYRFPMRGLLPANYDLSHSLQTSYFVQCCGCRIEIETLEVGFKSQEEGRAPPRASVHRRQSNAVQSNREECQVRAREGQALDRREKQSQKAKYIVASRRDCDQVGEVVEHLIVIIQIKASESTHKQGKTNSDEPCIDRFEAESRVSAEGRTRAQIG